MKYLQWVNDRDLAVHISHSKKTGIAEVGYTDATEAAESLLNVMDNDQKVMSIVLSAAANYLLNYPRQKKKFLEALKINNG